MAFNAEYWSRILLDPQATIGAGGTVETKIPYTTEGVPTSSEVAVLTNGIKLAAGSSATDNYYAGYDIILRKVQSDGTTYTQKKRISAYDGTSKIALLDDIWDSGFEPDTGDAYEIVLSNPDTRVSINPAIQLADYICSIRYGKGFNAETDLLLDTWLSSARQCDARSDVSLKLTSSQSMIANDIYSYIDSGRLIFEGKVKTTESTQYPLFTEVLGKITNKWNSWKSFLTGDIIYHLGNFYKATANQSFSTAPVHTAGTTNNLQYISSLSLTRTSGTGPASLALDLSKNPVLDVNANGEEISGYKLYDADSIDYWRRLGWDEHSQNSVTQYQTNFTIDTSAPLFDNINLMLEHMNGIFSYTQGRYALDIKGPETTFESVTKDDIIGSISFEDKGNKTGFNSVTVSYRDPGNNFESKNISLFSETFLKQDRNVPKKGNITVTGMTNYYNVRLLADSYLQQSRFDRTISLTLFPEFIKLVPGSIIGVTYPRYSWTDKKFRIDTMTINPDGSIRVIADEYQDSFYALTNLNKTPEVGKISAVTYTPLATPLNLTATNTSTSSELKDGILVKWSHPAGLSDPATVLELQSSDSSQATLTITDISSNLITTSPNHELKVGSIIRATSSGNGIISGEEYYVISVPGVNTLTISDSPGGSVKTLTNGSGLSITIDTFSFVADIPYPQNSYSHIFPEITASTTKYYRARYKSTK